MAVVLGCLGNAQAEAGFIATATQQSIASSTSFPGTIGTHTHSGLGQPVEVGSFNTSEAVRGVAEFNLAGQLPGSATLTFSVAQLGSSYLGQTGPGNYTIDVVAYAGNNAISLSDFQAASLGTLGSFSTASLTSGQSFSFDVTAAYNASLLSGGGSGSLGIRLQPTSDPGFNVANQFSSFGLQTSAATLATPAPSGLLLFATALPIAGYWRRSRGSKATESEAAAPAA